MSRPSFRPSVKAGQIQTLLRGMAAVATTGCLHLAGIGQAAQEPRFSWVEPDSILEPRAFHAMAYDAPGRQLYVVGGLAGSSARSFSEPQLLVGSLRGSWRVSWKEVAIDDRTVELSARYGAAAVFDEELGLIVYGGRGIGDGDPLDSKTYVLASGPGSEGQWQILAPGDVIGGRWGHSMVLDERNRRLFVIGGRSSATDSGDVFFLDLDSASDWKPVDLPGGAIHPRTGHATGIVTSGSRTHLVVLGGIDDCTVRSDAWLITIAEEELPIVRELEMSGDTDGGRAFAATGQFGILLYVFGGLDEHLNLRGADVVEFIHLPNTIDSGTVELWTEDTWGGPPSRRFGAGITYLKFASPGLMFAIVGGLGEDELGAVNPLSDTWLYQEPGGFATVPSWTPILPTATPIRPALHGAVGPLRPCSTVAARTATPDLSLGRAIHFPFSVRHLGGRSGDD